MHVNLQGIPGKAVLHDSKAEQEVRVNSCLLSGSKSRPHLSSFVDPIKGRKGAVLVRE